MKSVNIIFILLVFYFPVFAQESSFDTANNYLLQQEYDLALYKYLEVINQSQDTFVLAICHNNMGDILRKRGLFSSAISNFEKADSLFSLYNINYLYRAHIANNLGIIEKQKGNYYAAINKYKFGEIIAKYNNDSIQLSKIYNNIGNVYAALNEYDNAIGFYKEAVEIRGGSYTPPLINLAEIYFKTGALDTSRSYFEKAFKHSDNNHSITHLERRIKFAILLNRIGEQYKEQDIINNIEQSLSVRKNDFSLLRLNFELANYYSKSDDYERSIEYYNSCIHFLQELDNINTYWIQSLTRRGFEYLKNNHLQKAYTDFSRANQLIKKFKQYALLPESKILFSHAEQETADGLISCLYELYNESKNEKYLNEALYISANNKANELTEQQERIRSHNNVSKSNYQQIEKLNYLLHKVNNHTGSIKSSITLYNQIDSLYKIIEPDIVHKTKETPEEFASKLMTNIHKDLSIIDYVITESSIYSFIINKNEIHFKKLNKPDSLTYLVNKYFSLTSNSSKDIDYPAFVKEYYNLGSQIYTAIIEPVKSHLNFRLKIIPDEELYLLSFDGIPTSSDEPKRFTDINTLLEEFAISYDYSLKAYLSSSNAKIPGKATVFMPEYKNQNYTNLYDPEEIKELNKVFFNFKKYVKQDASKEAFINNGRKGISILSMHGEMDKMNPNFSRLIFRDDSIDNVHTALYNYELPVRDYSRNLIVLSACETGKGKIYKSSGSQSLGKSFRTLGATVIMSNWALDKYTSHKILLAFYKNIKDGQPKDIALREAKIQFLDECYSYQERPYYWQSIALYGNADKLNTIPVYGIIITTLLILIAVFTLRFYRKY